MYSFVINKLIVIQDTVLLRHVEHLGFTTREKKIQARETFLFS